ncbi:MAG TPA: methyltransferase [Bacteroidales bacterium]|nr:methyltransferase [Bacteroidales bacterium]HBZ21756.1 methyltransferase [Bacteroidales bacterium]
MITHSVCPLCSSGKISLNLKCTDHLLSREEFDLLKCRECGFVFTDKHPDELNIGRYYESEDYISHDDYAKGFLNHVYHMVRSLMLKKKRIIIQKATRLTKGRILDIGCGTGYFAATMKKGGWDVTGIEPNVKARDFARSHFALNVLSPEFISELPSGTFDCITLWHVLEHFHKPFSYAEEIKRLLKPEGICICALPNCSSFDANHYGEYWAAYDVPRHLWHFTPETFRFFAGKTGFHIKEIKSLPFDVFYISILSEKNKGTKFYFLKGIIKGSLFALRSLFHKSKSSSLIYLLKI